MAYVVREGLSTGGNECFSEGQQSKDALNTWLKRIDRLRKALEEQGQSFTAPDETGGKIAGDACRTHAVGTPCVRSMGRTLGGRYNKAVQKSFCGLHCELSRNGGGH